MRVGTVWASLRAGVRAVRRAIVVAPADRPAGPGPVARTTASAAPSNTVSGFAYDVIQARDVTGGITIARLADPEGRVPRQLPADPPRFVGRTEELERLRAFLDGPEPARVLAIVGTPGCGKSTLAVRLAHELLDRFPDGQLVLNLRGFDAYPPVSAHAALGALLRTLGMEPGAIPETLDGRAAEYRTRLAGKRVLVLADNAAGARHVEPLLPPGPGSLLIVTSRTQLIGLTSHGASHLRLGRLPSEDARRLFRTVTRGSRSHDRDEDIEQIVEQCARLPLAVRIVAERAASRPLRPLGELIEDLQSRTSLWQVLAGDEDQETEAVRAVFDSSYHALPRSLARTFRLLGLHPGPDFCPEAAAALLDMPPERTSAQLDTLASLHLLEHDPERRYVLHDLLRAYAADQADIDEKPEHRHNCLQRITTWYLLSADAAAHAAQNLYASVLSEPAPPEPPAMRFDSAERAREWFARERPNLLAALTCAHDARLDTTTWQLAATLHALYAASSAIDDWKRAATLGLESAERLGDPHARAQLLTMLANAHMISSGFEEAVALHRRALADYEARDDRLGQVRTTNSLGLIDLECRRLETATGRFERTLELAEASGYPTWTGLALDNLGATLFAGGYLQEAAERFRQALRTYREAGADARITVVPLLQLARVHRETEQLGRAEELLSEAEHMLAGGVFLSVEYDLLLERGALEHARGHHAQAEALYRICLQRQRALGIRSREAAALHGLGAALDDLGRHGEAVQTLDEAVAVRRKLPNPYHLASASADLARALLYEGLHQRANAARAEALTALAPLTDRRAAALRTRLTGLNTDG